MHGLTIFYDLREKQDDLWEKQDDLWEKQDMVVPKWACPTSLLVLIFWVCPLNGRWNARRSTRGNRRRRRIPSALQAGWNFL